MADKIKVLYKDKMVDATEISVVQCSEHWNDYILDDGSKLRIKLITSKVARVDNEYDLEGNPIYIFQVSNVAAVTAPKSLKKSI